MGAVRLPTQILSAYPERLRKQLAGKPRQRKKWVGWLVGRTWLWPTTQANPRPCTCADDHAALQPLVRVIMGTPTSCMACAGSHLLPCGTRPVPAALVILFPAGLGQGGHPGGHQALH